MSSQLVWSRGVDLYRVSEIHNLITSRTYKPDGTRRGIIFCHGVGQTGDGMVHGGSLGPILTALAAAGYPVMTADWSSPTYSNANWGNDDMIAAITAGWAYLKSPGGAKTDKFGIYGSSMGATSLNWIRQNLTNIFAFAGTIPVLDVDSLYQNDVGGYRAGIGLAYGVTYPTALPSPATYQAVNYTETALTGLPVALWPSSNDPIASNTAAATAWSGKGATVTITDLGPVGHDASTTDPQAVLGFFNANGGMT